ncbi:MAG: Flp family type IVb pilin [Thermodesulfovibrionales bacterium]
MKKIPEKAKEIMSTIREEKGAAAVEYALIAGLISVVIIPAVTTLGQRITTIFQTISNALPV